MLKRLKNDTCTCNKAKLASNKNASPNVIEYSKFLFSSQTYVINVNFTNVNYTMTISTLPFCNLIFKSI